MEKVKDTIVTDINEVKTCFLNNKGFNPSRYSLHKGGHGGSPLRDESSVPGPT